MINRNESLHKTKALKLMALVALSEALVGCTHSVQSVQPEQADQASQAVGEQYLEAMDKAYTEMDADALARLLHDDLTYQLSASQPGGPPQIISLTKDAWLQTLPQTWSAISDYSIERNDIQVARLESGNLLVTSTYTEVMTLQGLNLTSEAEEKIELESNSDHWTAREMAAEVATRISPGNQ